MFFYTWIRKCMRHHKIIICNIMLSRISSLIDIIWTLIFFLVPIKRPIFIHLYLCVQLFSYSVQKWLKSPTLILNCVLQAIILLPRKSNNGSSEGELQSTFMDLDQFNWRVQKSMYNLTLYSSLKMLVEKGKHIKTLF